MLGGGGSARVASGLQEIWNSAEREPPQVPGCGSRALFLLKVLLVFPKSLRPGTHLY